MAHPPDLSEIHVADAMHHGVLTCPPETPLRTVARMMADYRIHCVAVYTDADSDFDRRIWGIVSDVDLVGAVGGDLDERTAGGTAATPLVTTTPGETLERAAQLMREYATAHLVVVDGSADRPIGILSTLDLARVIGSRP
jgi:CBS domain-containing protein